MSILALIEGKKPEELGSIVKNSLDDPFLEYSTTIL